MTSCHTEANFLPRDLEFLSQNNCFLLLCKIFLPTLVYIFSNWKTCLLKISLHRFKSSFFAEFLSILFGELKHINILFCLRRGLLGVLVFQLSKQQGYVALTKRKSERMRGQEISFCSSEKIPKALCMIALFSCFIY